MEKINLDKLFGQNDNNRFRPLIAVIAVLFILIYLYALIFGETSLGVYFQTKWKKEDLIKEYNTLQEQNQKLQKEYFELIQLTPDSSLF